MSKSRVVKLASAVAGAVLLMASATSSNALTFNWSFFSAGDADNFGGEVKGWISGLHEGTNDGSGVTVAVTGTPTGDLIRSDWEFYGITNPSTHPAFTVTGGVLTQANAAFFTPGTDPLTGLDLIGPELYFSLNDTLGWYSPMLADRNLGTDGTYWYTEYSDTNFTARHLYRVNPLASWAILGSLLSDEELRPYKAARVLSVLTKFEAAPDVPLPAALPLFAAGLGAMGFFGWRKRRAAVTF